MRGISLSPVQFRGGRVGGCGGGGGNGPELVTADLPPGVDSQMKRIGRTDQDSVKRKVATWWRACPPAPHTPIIREAFQCSPGSPPD